MMAVTRVGGSGFPGRHVAEHWFISILIQGIQRRGDGKDCYLLPPLERGGDVGVPRNLFHRLGVG